MIHIFGIILLEKTAIVIRIYEVNKHEWKLIHYQNFNLKPRLTPAVHQAIGSEVIDREAQTESAQARRESLAEEINSVLANFLTTDNARYVTQWKTGARGISQTTTNFISSSLGLEIDTITPHREQELLCKGLFAELW